MQSQELSMGNYVYVQDNIVEVVAIEEQTIQVRSLPDSTVSDVDIEDIRPVSLKDELVRQICGFDKSGKLPIEMGGNRNILKLQDGYVILQDKNGDSIIQFWDVEYLHQLQNLYYIFKSEKMPLSFEK